MEQLQKSRSPLSAASASSAVAAWQHVALCDDVEEQESSQPDWSLRYEQLSNGRFRGRIEHVQLPGMRLVHEEANCATRQRGQIGRGHYGFAMPLLLTDHATFSGQRLDADSIMIGRSEDLDLCSPAGFGLVGIVVDASLLASLWARMYQTSLRSWLERQGVVQPNPAVASDLRVSHLRALALVAERPSLLEDAQAVFRLRDAILTDWIEAIPCAVETNELASGEARKRVVDRACDMMMGRPDEPPSILDVCSRVGCSPRKLDYCFRSVLGISAAKYLRTARLNGVRRDLRNAAARSLSVQDVATSWGFWHLGEFGAAYKRQFGELPSATLRGG